jgi:hypothetical protein
MRGIVNMGEEKEEIKYSQYDEEHAFLVPGRPTK